MWHDFPQTKPPAYKPVLVAFWYTNSKKPSYWYTIGRYQPNEGDIPEGWYLEVGSGLIKDSIVMAWQEIEPYDKAPNLNNQHLDEWGNLR